MTNTSPFSFLFPPGSLAWKEQFDGSGDLIEVALTPREQALLDHVTCGGSPLTFHRANPPAKSNVSDMLDLVMGKPGMCK